MIETLYTIGFTKKNLAQFIGLLQGVGVDLVLDVRRHNTSQLAGYSKKDDLAYVLGLVGIAYAHALYLAPDEGLLAEYKAKRVDWHEYGRVYALGLEASDPFAATMTDVGTHRRPALLCAEAAATKCHRRLAAAWLSSKVGGVEVVHL